MAEGRFTANILPAKDTGSENDSEFVQPTALASAVISVAQSVASKSAIIARHTYSRGTL